MPGEEAVTMTPLQRQHRATASAVAQAGVIDFLARPAAYAVDSVQRIDTHISIVFLAGERVYKLKRAMKTAFLDYSTLESRRRFCEAEVEINRRTAPEIYVGVVPVTRTPGGALALGGPGTPVEWLVEMRRFDQESVFDELEKMQQRIMQRAYEIFRANGDCPGKDLENWLQAENELVWKPDITLEEKADEFRLRVAVPGVEPKDIDIEVTPEDILIRADIHRELKDNHGAVYSAEFATGNLFRVVRLPKRIDPNKVKAEVKHGMLTIKAGIAAEALTKPVKVQAA
jgi:HSP20 family molecular chaperone IbpA